MAQIQTELAHLPGHSPSQQSAAPTLVQVGMVKSRAESFDSIAWAQKASSGKLVTEMTRKHRALASAHQKDISTIEQVRSIARRMEAGTHPVFISPLPVPPAVKQWCPEIDPEGQKTDRTQDGGRSQGYNVVSRQRPRIDPANAWIPEDVISTPDMGPSRPQRGIPAGLVAEQRIPARREFIPDLPIRRESKKTPPPPERSESDEVQALRASLKAEAARESASQLSECERLAPSKASSTPTVHDRTDPPSIHCDVEQKEPARAMGPLHANGHEHVLPSLVSRRKEELELLSARSHLQDEALAPNNSEEQHRHPSQGTQQKGSPSKDLASAMTESPISADDARIEDYDATSDTPQSVLDKTAQKVLHRGHGGLGRRRKATGCGCYFRQAKCQVVRGVGSLRRSQGRPTTVEFVFAEDSPDFEIIALSHKTVLKVKGASSRPRIELVQPDGRHMWLWSVPTEALEEVFEAFEDLVAPIRGAVHQPTIDVDFRIKNKETVPASARAMRSQMVLREDKADDDDCMVQLGFAPAGAQRLSSAAVVVRDEKSVLQPCSTSDTLPYQSASGTDRTKSFAGQHHNGIREANQAPRRSCCRSIFVPTILATNHNQNISGKPFVPALNLSVLGGTNETEEIAMPGNPHDSAESTVVFDAVVVGASPSNLPLPASNVAADRPPAMTLEGYESVAPLQKPRDTVVGLLSPVRPPETPAANSSADQASRGNDNGVIGSIRISTPSPGTTRPNFRLKVVTGNHSSQKYQSERAGALDDARNASLTLPTLPEFRTSAFPAMGREYRSHVLRRIDPASTLNVQLLDEQRAGTGDADSEMLGGARVYDPRDMDDIIKHQHGAIHNAVVLM